MKKIIFDTNILIYAVKSKLDLSALKGYELYTLESVVKELEKIAKGRGRDALAARAALKQKSLKILHTNHFKSADEALLHFGKKGFVIATQDRELIRKLKDSNCNVIQMRQKKYLEGLM